MAAIVFNDGAADSERAVWTVTEDGPPRFTWERDYTVETSPGEESEAATRAPGLPALRDLVVSGVTNTVGRVEKSLRRKSASGFTALRCVRPA